MAETERNNLPVAEEPEFTAEIPAIRPDDPVHFAQMNAMLESLLGNDVFLKRLANKMIENSLIAHVLDCENSQMVLGADQGPAITGLIDGVKEDVTQLYSEITGGILTYNPDTGYFGMQYNGKWNDVLFAGLEAFWLYNKGNEFTARTGGWVGSNNISGSKMTKYSDHINLLAVPGGASHMSMANSTAVDFSNFDKLYIDMECISENPYLTYFITLYSQEGSTINLKVSNDGPISRRVITYDIASYNSKYIINISARNTYNIEKNCNVNVYSVRLA